MDKEEDVDLVQVYLYAYFKGKYEAETELDKTRDKLLEDATKENIQLKERIKELEEREQKIKYRIKEAIDFAVTGDCKKYFEKEIKTLQNVLNLYEEGETANDN